MRRIILIIALIAAGIISYNDDDVEYPRPWLMLAGLFFLCGLWIVGAVFVGVFVLHIVAIICNFSFGRIENLSTRLKEKKEKYSKPLCP